MARLGYYNTYRINKAPTDQEDGRPIVLIDTLTLFKAAQDLNSAYVFKLWVYFASHYNTEKLMLTKQDIMDSFNMARTTLYDCLKVLEEKGYLVEREDGIYEFYEDPAEDKKNA